MNKKYFDKYKFTSTEEATELYLNGFINLKLKQDELHQNFLDTLETLKTQPKEGFRWVEKYPSSFDLYPNTYSYDDIFLDFLFSQGLPKKIKDSTGNQLYLGDIALRIVFPGATYMSWHRDTYKYKNKKAVGRFPAMHKIIFYPCLRDTPTPQIQLSPGSHRRLSTNKYLDKAQIYLNKKCTINSSNNKAIFFESSIFHNPLNSPNPNGSYRLIYNFVYESQLSQFKGREELHQAYKERLNKEPK